MIGNQVIKQVTASVASEVSQTAASKLLLGFSQVHDQLVKAVDGSEQLRAGAAKADSGAHQLASGRHEPRRRPRTISSSGAKRLDTGIGQAASGADNLEAGAGAARVRAGHAAVAHRDACRPRPTGWPTAPSRSRQATEPSPATAPRPRPPPPTSGGASPPTAPTFLAALRAQGLTDAQLVGRRVAPRRHRRLRRHGRRDDPVGLPRPDAPVDRRRPGGDRRPVARQRHPGPDRRHRRRPTPGPCRCATARARLAGGLDTLKTGSASSRAGAARAAIGRRRPLASGATSLASGLDALTKGATDLHAGLVKGRDSVPDPSDAQRKAMAQTIGNPVGVSNGSLSSAGSYGAGLAPLFMSLALWIGAYVLFLFVRPLSPRALATSQRSVRTALGGWLAPTLVGSRPGRGTRARRRARRRHPDRPSGARVPLPRASPR